MKRSLTWSVGVVALLLGAFYLGGGWYLSGQIASGALDVRHEQEWTLDVVAVDGDRITLRVMKDAPEQPALTSNMTYGLVWEGGSGQVLGPAEPTDGGVSRQFRVLQGAAPVAGEPAQLDRDAFSGDDPTVAVGKPVRDVRYSSGGETFPAWFVPGRNDTWVVFVHGGLGSDREEPLRAMRVTARLGMPSLNITYRNDIGAPQDPSGRYQYGRAEWRDLEGAVQYAVDNDAKQVVLMGYSMGGAVIAAFLERSELAATVSRVVLDSPALDLRTMIAHGAAQRSLPVIGGLPRSLVWTAEQMAAVRDDVDWDAINYVDDSDWLRVPGLIFHGDDDLKVPVRLSRSLAADHPDTVTLDVVHGAGHVESWNTDPTGYERALRTFLTAA